MLITGVGREFIIKDTHRGLYYEDGKLTKVLCSKLGGTRFRRGVACWFCLRSPLQTVSV